MGQTLELRWSAHAEGADRAGTPPPEAVAAGRTQPKIVMVKLGYDHNPPERIRRMIVWTRPGKAEVLMAGAVPPGRYESLPTSSAVEVQAIAVTDIASGSAQLKRRDGVARLTWPSSKAPGDRASMLRLYLDVEPLGP